MTKAKKNNTSKAAELVCQKCATEHTGTVNLARSGSGPHGDFRCGQCDGHNAVNLTEEQYSSILDAQAD